MFLGYGVVNGFRLGKCGFGEDVRKMMLSDDDFIIDARLFRPAENFDHAPPRRPAGDRRPCDLDIDDVTIARAQRVRRRNADLVEEPFIDGRDEGFGFELYECADDGFICVIQHCFDSALTATLANASDASDHRIAVQTGAHRPSVYEEVSLLPLFRVIGHNERVT